MNDCLTSRTEEALGQETLSKIRDLRVCILGCGAVGTLMAEMLARTGAEDFTLVDGDKIEESNLNRTFSFLSDDVGKKKVEVLKERLKQIHPSIKVDAISKHLNIASSEGDEIIYAISNSNCVIIAMDDNPPRRFAEEQCDKHGCPSYMSIGLVFKKNNTYSYECAWKPITPENSEYEDGDGYENGSYISALMEATAVGFQMLLSHIHPDGKEQQRVLRTFANFDANPTKEQYS